MRLPSQKPAGVYPSAQGLSTEKHAPGVGIRLRRDLAVSRPSGVEYGKLVVKHRALKARLMRILYGQAASDSAGDSATHWNSCRKICLFTCVLPEGKSFSAPVD